ncbi:MAG: BglII/BstYI family type II restriction endonuclease [Rectinema sp.]
MPISDFSEEILSKYEIYEWKHSIAILKNDFPSEWTDLLDLLQSIKIKRSWITTPGGSKSPLAEWIDDFMSKRGWVEKKFLTSVIVDDSRMDSPTHKVDSYKNRIAVELEWNNKDPFYDRDLNNFRLLFDLRAISVGVIITRCDELQEIFDRLGRRTSYGNSTTHISKLLPKIEGGGGAGCPILAIGMTKALYEED